MVSGKGEAIAPSCQSDEWWEGGLTLQAQGPLQEREKGLQGQVQLASGLGQAGLGSLVSGGGHGTSGIDGHSCGKLPF